MVVADWYDKKDLTYTSEEIIWLLRNRSTLKNGDYPERPTSYVDVGVSAREAEAAAMRTLRTRY